tara:strand:- start:115 stop:291 length:177 start_codon:yes stop_codon:yes gene_type:complete
MGTYKDNSANRKLNRVGKHYGKGMASSTRAKKETKCYTKKKEGGTYVTCERKGSQLRK